MNKRQFVPLTPEIFERARALYDEGYGIQMIQRKLNISEHTLRDMLKEAGILRTLQEARKLIKQRAARTIRDWKL